MGRPKNPPKPAVAAGRTPVIIESEKSALGAALRDSDAAEVISSELDAGDFYSPQTQKAFVAVQGLVEDGLSVNPVSVSERAGIVLSDLEELVDRAEGVGPSQLKTLVSELTRVSELRTIYTACMNATAQMGTDSKVEEAVSALEKGLYQSDKKGSSEAQDGSQVLANVRDGFLNKVRVGGGAQVSTGLAELDRAIISFSGPKVYVIAARPSMGKTALSSTIRRSILGQGLAVVEFNLEMGAEEIAERELSFQARLNLRKVLSGKDVSEEELERARGIDGKLFQGLWFIDDRTYNIAGMRRKARVISGRLARQGKRIGAVIIDYIQLAGENGDGREQSVAAISRGCKLMAKELGCPVMALSQLNRGCEYREDRRPIMSDLRESGAIEQDADGVWFIYREHLYDQSFPPEEAELIIRKQRSGPIGTVRLRYNPKLVTFENSPIPAIPTPGQTGQADAVY